MANKSCLEGGLSLSQFKCVFLIGSLLGIELQFQSYFIGVATVRVELSFHIHLFSDIFSACS